MRSRYVGHDQPRWLTTTAGAIAVAALLTAAAPAAAETTSVPERGTVASMAPAGDAAMEGGSCGVTAPMILTQGPLVGRSDSSGAEIEAGPGSAVGVTCALPYERGRPGADCTGWHTVRFATVNASPDAKVTAELVAYDANGVLIQTLPVKNGDSAHLASKIDPADFKMVSSNKKHEVFAPLPMLRVKVEDAGQTAIAYCSNVPYLEVLEPHGAVISEDAGNVTRVVAAAPRADARTVDLKIDGVHILQEMTPAIPDPSVCTGAAPCSGSVVINGANVSVSNLVVDLAPDIGVPASNTISFNLEGQACGGHVYVVDADYLANARKIPTSGSCLVDDVLDKGFASIFAITIDSPLPGDQLGPPPTQVTGEVCSGRPIVSVQLNGMNASVAGQTCVTGDGENTADTCTVAIDSTLGQTDLAADVATGDVPPGTFDLGTNRLVASATDDAGSRTFKRVTFTAGNTAAPGLPPAALFSEAALEDSLQQGLKSLIMPEVEMAMDATMTEIDNAFVVGISAAATQKLFNQLCTAPVVSEDPEVNGLTPGQIFSKKVKAAIEAIPSSSTSIPSACSCDPTVTIKVDSVTVGNDVTCNVTFSDGKFNVQMGLPDISVVASAKGSCGGYEDDICFEGIGIDMTSTASITGVNLNFDVTEDNLLNKTTTPAVFFEGTTATTLQGEPDLCGFSEVCDVFVTIFTLGFVDVTPEIDVSKVQDFESQVGASEPDPVKLNEIKVDEQVVAEFNQTLEGNVSDVQITPEGITAGLKGRFATNVVDDEIDPTLGAVLTPASVPTLPVPNAQDVFIGLADDTINMLFASMTAAGSLKNECRDTGKTVASLLDLDKSGATNAADCDSITLDTPLATALARGTCHGVIGTNCETISMSAVVNDLNTATEQGVCHAMQGANCNAIALPAGPLAAVTEHQLCTNTPNPNIHGDQRLLFCARQELPPRMLLADNTATNPVEATLRLNDLTVGLVLDRTGPGGTPDGAIDGPLAGVTGCFATGAPTNIDCNLFATCMDLNLNFNMQFQTCEDGKPGFVNQFQSIQVLNREPGVVCNAGGSTAGTDSAVLDVAQADDTVTIDLTARAQDFAPPICGAGLDLGGFVTCTAPKIISMDTDAPGTFKDYVGITCQVP